MRGEEMEAMIGISSPDADSETRVQVPVIDSDAPGKYLSETREERRETKPSMA